MQSEETLGTEGIPHLVTHAAHTICYPDPLTKANDTIWVDLETDKIIDVIKCATGNLCVVAGDADLGKIGTITNRGRHPGALSCLKSGIAGVVGSAARFEGMGERGK